THQHNYRKHSQHADGTLAASRVLVSRSAALVKQVVQSMWVQQQRAQELMEAIEVVRGHMRGPRTKKRKTRSDELILGSSVAGEGTPMYGANGRTASSKPKSRRG